MGSFFLFQQRIKKLSCHCILLLLDQETNKGSIKLNILKVFSVNNSHHVLYVRRSPWSWAPDVRGLSTTNLEYLVKTINKDNTVPGVFYSAIKKKRGYK